MHPSPIKTEINPDFSNKIRYTDPILVLLARIMLKLSEISQPSMS